MRCGGLPGVGWPAVVGGNHRPGKRREGLPDGRWHFVCCGGGDVSVLLLLGARTSAAGADGQIHPQRTHRRSAQKRPAAADAGDVVPADQRL
ncbi:hypothetical protein D3C75_718360 [compost metagenome]